MDCRTSLVIVAGCLALTTGTGCFGRQTVPPIAPHQQQAAQKPSERPRKGVKAETWVAYGNFYEQSAANPDMQPMQRRSLNDEARKSYHKALEIDPKCRDAYLCLARLHAGQGEENFALDMYHKATQKHPKDATVWYEYGMFLGRKKDWEKAIVCLHRAVELDPDNREYTMKYGFTLARAGRYDDGVACLSRVMQKAEAHYNVARMLHHLQQPDLCKQHLNVALQQNPNLAPARQMLAQIESGGSIAQIRFDTGTP